MVLLAPHRILVAILRNLAHAVLGGIRRGGHRTTVWSEQERRAHGESIHKTLAPYVGDVSGQVGLEIGPGDNLEVCQQFLGAGSERMIAVERYSKPSSNDGRLAVLRAPIESMALHEEVDFAYSNDAFEHVADVPASMKAIYAALRPGGRFVSSIDLRGHNVFHKPGRSLDFLTCPDWLWKMMFSHIATTNRVRAHEFIDAATAAGFTVKRAEALAVADQAYVERIRPHLLPRYQGLSSQELAILQFLLVVERPASMSKARASG